jgi:hypothetical protein
MDPLSSNKEIGLIFSRSPLGHKPRRKRWAARAVYQVEFELGISFLKLADGKPGIINDVYGDLTLRVSRLQSFIPLNLPVWFGLSTSPRSSRNNVEE